MPPFSDNHQSNIETIFTTEGAENMEKKPLRSPRSPRWKIQLEKL